ncbi:adhesion G protein-coupled receptor B2-like [Nematostella vectensis]|uniref:adhesion G protein-coupled receptor B2-like n=1 Tax=Nematostella vectensis TaxID=45351 RepID=UPI00207786B5|nr:adhesion G protein-coupled receptor B2-like [Nematostella vectensis]
MNTRCFRVLAQRFMLISQAQPDYNSNHTKAGEGEIYVCHDASMTTENCNGTYVEVDKDESVRVPNGSLYLNSTKRIYRLYFYDNDSLWVCKNLSRSYTKENTKIDDVALRYLTAVCMSLSVISMSFLLLTYRLFKELRTIPGINMMNLAASLLMAQLLWQVSGAFTLGPVFCTITACFLHYLFLVSFLWTSIIAYDTWKAFSNTTRPRLPSNSKNKRTRQILNNMALGWLPVMVYVTVCVALDQSGAVAIGYGSDQACWIANKNANLCIFGLPVALMILFNFTLFIFTVKAIRVTEKQSRKIFGDR